MEPPAAALRDSMPQVFADSGQVTKESMMNIAVARYAVVASTFAICALSGPTLAAGTPKGGNAVLTPASEIKWGDVPGFPGVQIAAVSGDPSKSGQPFMLKFTGGFAAPLHHHTSDHHGTVVAGTLVLGSGGREVKLPPGSYFKFTGKAPHTTKCEAGADCILAMNARTKWDVVADKTK
jgi:quercetin dioxygenase-like cupin family protein